MQSLLHAAVQITAEHRWARYSDTNQNVLDLILATLDVVHDHVLEDVLPVLQLVHLVIGVGVQHGPAQELGQGLDV